MWSSTFIDEVGYLTYGTDAANMLFHVVNDRHRKKRAMVFTTNKALSAWGHVLHDEDLAQAILDRILERGRLLALDGPSMRTKHLGLDDPTSPGASDQPARISGIQRPEFPEPTGSALLRYALEQCDRDGMPAYLESSNPRNIPLYQRHGFEIIGTIQAGSSPTVVPMLRRARRAQTAWLGVVSGSRFRAAVPCSSESALGRGADRSPALGRHHPIARTADRPSAAPVRAGRSAPAADGRPFPAHG